MTGDHLTRRLSDSKRTWQETKLNYWAAILLLYLVLIGCDFPLPFMVPQYPPSDTAVAADTNIDTLTHSILCDLCVKVVDNTSFQ